MSEHDFKIGQIVSWCGRIWLVMDVAHQGAFQVKVQIANYPHCPPHWVDHRGMRLCNDDDATENECEQQAGVWVSHTVHETYGGSDHVFGTEIEALRYALSNMEMVKFVPFGLSANDDPEKAAKA